MKPNRAGFDLFDWARRHPFVVAALALHGLLLAGLYLAGPYTLTRQQRAQDMSRVGASLEAARREQVTRHLQRLEQLGKELGAEAPASPASSPLERAEALTRRIEQTEQHARAKELARLLKIKPEEALAKLRAEETKRARPLPRDPAQAMAQLERRARAAAEQRQARERRESEGMRVARSEHDGSRQDPSGTGHGGSDTGNGRGKGHGGGEATDSIGGVGETERQYEAMASPPPLDPARLRYAEARSFGPGAPFANRVYLDRWNVVGPFPARSSRSLDEVHPPELAVDLDAVYEGKHGIVGWQAQHSANYPFVPEPREADALYYAYTEVRVDRDTEVWLDIGADDDSKLWVNDELVWVSGNGDKAWYHRAFYRLDDELSHYALVEGRVRVTLKAGRNTLLLKLYNGVDLMFFSVVIAR